jgi:hypothetical protein
MPIIVGLKRNLFILTGTLDGETREASSIPETMLAFV